MCYTKITCIRKVMGEVKNTKLKGGVKSDKDF